MLNQIVLVGRVKGFLREDIGKNRMVMTIDIPRNKETKSGTVEADLIDIYIPSTLMENAKTYINPEDLVGVKGRVETQQIEFNNAIYNAHELIAEKLTFLKSGNGKAVE